MYQKHSIHFLSLFFKAPCNINTCHSQDPDSNHEWCASYLPTRGTKYHSRSLVDKITPTRALGYRSLISITSHCPPNLSYGYSCFCHMDQIQLHISATHPWLPRIWTSIQDPRHLHASILTFPKLNHLSQTIRLLLGRKKNL